MSRKLLLLLALAGAFVVSTATAEEVVSWVDKHGVTHFGNAQFAPAGQGEPVKLKPANGMAVPDLRGLNRRNSPRNPNMVVLDRPKLENPRGWRGYNSRKLRGR